jgi:hypothetical protein
MVRGALGTRSRAIYACSGLPEDDPARHECLACQAAEKYLKSYIVAFNLEFRKIHDLIALLKICSAKDDSFTSFFKS